MIKIEKVLYMFVDMFGTDRFDYDTLVIYNDKVYSVCSYIFS